MKEEPRIYRGVPDSARIVMNEVTQLFIWIGVTAQTQLAIMVTLQSN